MSDNNRDRGNGNSRTSSRRSSSASSSRRTSAGTSSRRNQQSRSSSRGNAGRYSGGNTSGIRPNGRNSLLIIILTVIVIVSIIAGAFVSAHRSSLSQPSSNVVNESTGETSLQVVEGDNKLELNKYPEVNELIANYRKAFQDGDTDLLKQVYNTDEDINQSILTGTSAVIEDYRNTQYYTKRGLKNGEYVAFVYDELKLADIDTLAPNLSVFYIKTADNGNLYIYRGEYNSSSGTYEYDTQTQNYLDSLYQDQDVIELIQTVNTRMDSACANDSALMSFMERLRSQTDESITGSGTQSETESSQTGETGSSSSETSAETGTVQETDTSASSL